MNELDCRQIQDLLVDYSDGELESKLAARVDAHLERCVECRAQLGRLEASLELADEVWTESARSVADVALTPIRRRPSTARRAVLVLASTAAALLIGLFTWQHLTEEKTPLAGGTRPLREGFTDEIEPSEQDLLALIDRVERRARLQVSLELLEQTPSLRPYAEEAERYLAAAYGDLDDTETPDTFHPSGTQEERL